MISIQRFRHQFGATKRKRKTQVEKHTHGSSANLLHLFSKVLNNVARLDRLSELFDLFGKGGEGSVGNLVATVLGQQFLLGWEIEIFVGHDLVPDASSIDMKTVRRHTLGVLRLEDVVGVRGGGKSDAKLVHVGFKLLGLEELVGKSCEHEVEVICDPAVLQTLGLGEAMPDALQIGAQGVGQVGKRS